MLRSKIFQIREGQLLITLFFSYWSDPFPSRLMRIRFLYPHNQQRKTLLFVGMTKRRTDEHHLEVNLFYWNSCLFWWGIIAKDLVRSEDRNDDDRGEIDLQNCREIFRIVFESPDISHNDSDKCKNHNDDDRIDSEKYQIHSGKISTALSVFIFSQKSRFSPRKEFRSVSRNSRAITLTRKK